MSESQLQPETFIGYFKRRALSIAIALTACVAVSAFLMIPLSRIPVSATLGWTNALSLQLTAWGLVVSVGGFGFTLWQLHRTQSAAAAVTAALARIKRDYSSFDLITEVRTARACGEATQSHLGGRRWAEAVSTYDGLRSSLNKISAVRNVLDVQQVETAKDYVAAIIDACSSLAIEQQKVDPEIPLEGLSTQLRQMDGFLIALEYSLKDTFHGQE